MNCIMIPGAQNRLEVGMGELCKFLYAGNRQKVIEFSSACCFFPPFGPLSSLSVYVYGSGAS